MRCRIISIFVIIILMHTVSGCSDDVKNMKVVDDKGTINTNYMAMGSGELVDNRSIYNDDKPDSVVHLYVTVLKENIIADGKVTTMADLNNYRYRFGASEQQKKPKVEIILQEGTADGPAQGYFEYGAKTGNATMEPRGHTAATAVQQSFKIRLYDKAGLWKDQRVINLNKHPRDFSRIRNKLSFDYFKMIPDMVGMRTQFVNLHIKDLSDEANKDRFIDYGLFTQIEDPNKTFLRNHGLDPNGHLYKAEFFEFYRYPESLKPADDPLYSEEEFEKVLSIEGSEDHKKLLQMLDDVNDYSKDINDVVDRHFNRDNMLTWLGSNILMGNIDTQSQNYLLYSPLNSDTWYFLPWDYDGAFGYSRQIGVKPEYQGEWEEGISNYWGVVLFNRFFKDPDNLKALSEKVEYLTGIINKENTMKLLDKYYEIAYKYVSSYPDLNYLPSMVRNYSAEYARIADETEKNHQIYLNNIQKPLPVYLGEAVLNDGEIKFNWDRSYDFQGDSIIYDFQISTSPDFSNIIVEKKGLIDNEISVERLMAGIYYWRVLIYDSNGNRQAVFDYYRDDKRDYHYGIKQFIVKDN